MLARKNKKEEEYNKIRSISRRTEGLRILRKVYKFFYFLLVSAFVLVLVYVLFFSPFLAVSDIRIDGLQEIDTRAISSVAANVYEGKYLNIFPKNNFILFPVSKLKTELKDEFKRIRVVEVSKIFPNTVIVTIEERESLLIWCDFEQECFILDENGVAYSRVALDSKEVLENNLIKVSSGEDQRKVVEGEKILSNERISFLLDSHEKFSGLSGIGMTGEIYLKSRMAEEIVLKTSEGWNIVISTNLDIQKSVDSLKMALEKGLASPEERSALEQIDLRIENRIYYKFKQPERDEGGEESIEKNSGQDN